jgi:FMN phosphatase YigB (HAD superfamily)
MKYLAIDIGQVICHLKFEEFNKKLAEFAKITEDEANAFLFNSQKAHDLGFSILEKDLNNKFYGLNLQPEQVAEVVRLWHNTVIPNPIVMKWLEKLVNLGVEIAIVSNIGMEHAETMKTLLAPIYDHYNVTKFFSCFVGARKPTYVYYQTFLTMYPQFKGCVYMDDNLDNIETGMLFDFNSIPFDLSKMNDEEITFKLKDIESSILPREYNE